VLIDHVLLANRFSVVILSEFPEDPIPIPSEHLLELLFEYAALKAQHRPNTVHTLHPSVLLSTTIVVNDYIKNMLTPSVLEHVNRCLDAEEAEEAVMAEQLNHIHRDHAYMDEYEDYVDAEEQGEEVDHVEDVGMAGSEDEALVEVEENDSKEIPQTNLQSIYSTDYLDDKEDQLRRRRMEQALRTNRRVAAAAQQMRSKRASAHAAVAKMSSSASHEK